MPVCRGCQDLKDFFFNLDLNCVEYLHTVIHNNFAELSKCADAFCDLCKFFRREFWYPRLRCGYRPREAEIVGDPNAEITVELYYTRGTIPNDADLSWSLSMGRENCVQDKRLCRTSLKEEIRAENPSFEMLIELARDWIATCRTEHRCCELEATEDPTYLPTRLLDVGLPGEDAIRLIISNELMKTRKASYITLSYCWGHTNNSACTTKNNLSERLEATPICSLPQTLQDAITVTGLLVRDTYGLMLFVSSKIKLRTKTGNESCPTWAKSISIHYSRLLRVALKIAARDSCIGRRLPTGLFATIGCTTRQT